MISLHRWVHGVPHRAIQRFSVRVVFLAHFNTMQGTVFIHLNNMAFGLLQELHEHQANRCGTGKHIEEGLDIDEGIHRQEKQRTGIAVGAGKPGDLAGHAALN